MRRRDYPHAVTHWPGLTPVQEALLGAWLPGAEVVADHSWGLTDTAVLHVSHQGRDLVVKAGGATNHHIGREIDAHPLFTAALAGTGRAARLVHADTEARVLVLEHLPGHLVEGTDAEWRPDTYAQAGALLATLHAQGARLDPVYEQRADRRALEWLDRPHRIAPDAEVRLRQLLTGGERPAATMVPTHGDWQPRNWLVDEGTVRVIDFGRAEWRPAATDLARLAAQQFRGRPDLEQAFLDGYGDDPREPGPWRRIRLREAVGTALWAHQVGDEEFEAQGHRMIEEALAG